MSISVDLINRRNSQPNKINFTRLKLSKNIDLHTKHKTNLCLYLPKIGGGEQDRTADPLLAKQVLSQLSYSPLKIMGPEGLEPSTPVLSGLCSNQLSYGPKLIRIPITHNLTPAILLGGPATICGGN